MASVKKDLTRLAVERAQQHAVRALEIIQQQVPIGPHRVGLSQAAMRRKFASWGPEQRRLWMQAVGGPDIAGEILDGATS